MGLEKIHDPLNEVQKQLILREKESEILQKKVSNLKELNQTQVNWKTVREIKEVINNFQTS